MFSFVSSVNVKVHSKISTTELLFYMNSSAETILNYN